MIRGRDQSVVRRRLSACVVTGFMLLGARAPAAHAQSCEADALRRDAALRVEDLGDWEPVDERTVLVWPPGGTRAYLLRLAAPVPQLTEIEMIALEDGDRDGLITACGHDAVMLDDAVAKIATIEHLSEQRTAELDHRGWTAI